MKFGTTGKILLLAVWAVSWSEPGRAQLIDSTGAHPPALARPIVAGVYESRLRQDGWSIGLGYYPAYTSGAGLNFALQAHDEAVRSAAHTQITQPFRQYHFRQDAALSVARRRGPYWLEAFYSYGQFRSESVRQEDGHLPVHTRIRQMRHTAGGKAGQRVLTALHGRADIYAGLSLAVEMESIRYMRFTDDQTGTPYFLPSMNGLALPVGIWAEAGCGLTDIVSLHLRPHFTYTINKQDYTGLYRSLLPGKDILLRDSEEINRRQWAGGLQLRLLFSLWTGRAAGA